MSGHSECTEDSLILSIYVCFWKIQTLPNRSLRPAVVVYIRSPRAVRALFTARELSEHRPSWFRCSQSSRDADARDQCNWVDSLQVSLGQFGRCLQLHLKAFCSEVQFAIFSSVQFMCCEPAFIMPMCIRHSVCVCDFIIYLFLSDKGTF